MEKDKKDQVQVALDCELVGIKNLKSTQNWRLELDVSEIDTHKIKELFDLIDMPITVGIVGSKLKKDVWNRDF